MLLFSKRYELVKLFETWAINNEVEDSAFNMITWLHINGLLNEEKAKEFIKQEILKEDGYDCARSGE